MIRYMAEAGFYFAFTLGATYASLRVVARAIRPERDR